MRTLLVIISLFFVQIERSEAQGEQGIVEIYERVAAEHINAILNNISNEASDCAAYFLSVAALMDERDKGTAAAYFANAVLAQDLSIALTDQEVYDARLSIALNEMKSTLDRRGGVSVLMDQYAARCKELIEQPQEHFTNWVRFSLNN